MARKPDTPCAGCGKLMWGGTTSLPEGKRTCLECRRAGRGPVESTSRGKTFACDQCGKDFVTATSRRPRFCSRACFGAGMKGKPGRVPSRAITCRDCGAVVVRRGTAAVMCLQCAGDATRARNHAKDACRRGALPASRRVTMRYLGNRDGWRCHLCRRQIKATLVYPHPMSPSIDHLVPVSHGGGGEPSNLALAHWRCNVRRGNRGVVQLALIG